MRTRLQSVAARLLGLAGRRELLDDPAWTRVVDALIADHGVARITDTAADPGGDAGAEDDDAVFRDELDVVAAVFGLGPVQALALASIVAPHLDATIAAAYDLLTHGTSGRPTVGLVLELCDLPSAGPVAQDLLGSAARLAECGLVTVRGDSSWLRQEVDVPLAVVGHLAGREVAHPALDDVRMTDVVAVVDEPAVRAARLIAAGEPLVWLRTVPGGGGVAAAAGAFVDLEMPALCIDVTTTPRVDLAATVGSALLEAGLHASGLVVVGLDEVGSGDPGRDDPTAPPVQVRAALRRLAAGAVPVVAVGQQAWRAEWPTPVPVTVDAAAVGVERRRSLWATGLPTLSAEELSTVDGDRRSPEEIAAAVRHAHKLAAAEGRDDVNLDLVLAALRRLPSAHSRRPGVGVVPSMAGPRVGFADLVLPDHVMSELHRLVRWATHRDAVVGRGAVHGVRGKGVGLAALFTGGPGTGKTLAANVLADVLDRELMQVDLSAVVDKYIGETEKNLERIFADAEARDVVLFFDEADSLFGSRGEVRDSRDRYANQEVSYLLQRMERFNGVTLLATNLRGNLDPAFSRRLQFIVHFPDPDVPTRVRLWETLLAQAGELDADDPVDVEALAADIELAGGELRNIVLGAAYDAVSAGEAVGMRHVAAAAGREYLKLGRRHPRLIQS